MSCVFGWVGRPGDPRGGEIGQTMARALRMSARETVSISPIDGGAIGIVCSPGESSGPGWPVTAGDGRYSIWIAGEVFSCGNTPLPFSGASSAATHAFRVALLDGWLARDAAILSALDGEYQMAVWDAVERRLALANDRFGGLPVYYAATPEGWAFAGAVRGVLTAPGVRAEPDIEAIREAVSFGGYRLGDRTNIASVKMMRRATIARVSQGQARFDRYHRWTDIPEVRERDPTRVIDELGRLWRNAVGRRLDGAHRPGQTLSGGLDSRAILAEAAPRVPIWTAITYGAPGCDDARYARRAAGAAGAHWRFQELYPADWLHRRTQMVQATDGLIDLVDLMHLEALPLQAELLDVHLSGFVGDAVIGPTFNDVESPADLLHALPFYGTPLGCDDREGLARAREMAADADGAACRFALFEHKIPQSTNRWTAAWRPWLRVRKPFLDYAFFDFCQGLRPELRGRERVYERWLRRAYPHCFRSIPNQRTGVPVLASRWRAHAARARRFTWKQVQPALAGTGLHAPARVRSYHLDEAYWRGTAAGHEIRATILRPESVCCEALGRGPVEAALSAWFDRGEGPIQPLAAMYVAEVYHRDLAATLRAASRPPSAEVCMSSGVGKHA